MRKLFFLMVASLLSACQGESQALPNNLDGWQIVDARTAEEFGEKHLVHAIHLPHDQVQKLAPTLIPDQSKPVLVYCRSGRRSEIATQELRKMGYDSVVNAGALKDLSTQYPTEP